MAAIFLSHASRDNDAARRLDVWVRQRGYDDVFLDIHKTDGIAPGMNWHLRLAEAMKNATMAVCLISDHWLQSKWCAHEFAAAVMSGKSIVPVVISRPADGPWAEMRRELQNRFGNIQYADLSQSWDAGLAQLEGVIKLLRIAPEAFEVPRDAAPWRGLSSYQAQDAGLFFGRESETQTVFEKLRLMAAESSTRRFLVLNGASGTGKSSLLRAGLWPQLAMRKVEWAPLAPFIPEYARDRDVSPLKALARNLSEAGAGFSAPDTLAQMAEDARAFFDAFLAKKRALESAPNATLVLCVDQAEEMLRAPAAEQTAFANAIAAWCDAPGRLAIMTIRTDTWEDAQARHVFEQLSWEQYPLAPMPLARIADTIRDPARRVGAEIEEALVNQAVEDARTGDALPLLSFTLEQLWKDHGPTKKLTLAGYEAMGQRDGETRVSPLENSLNRAALMALGELPKAEEAALGDAFVPGLVDLTDGLAPVRRRTEREKLPASALPLLDKLVEARLLKSDMHNNKETLEVVHEALLRRWPLLTARIEAALPDLRLIQEIERAAADYARAMGGGR
jgi:hypothetical protein